MSTLTIRPARYEDLAALLTLYEHLNPIDLPLPPPDDLERLWTQILGRELPIIFLAETDGGVVVGSCALAVIPGLTRGARPFGTIENVVTHTAHRKKGVGSMLVKHAVARAWEQGCYKILLMTGSKREETLRFYERLGFRRDLKTGFVMSNPQVELPPR
jgi:GNAT superfamily N-acetyltransferase